MRRPRLTIARLGLAVVALVVAALAPGSGDLGSSGPTPVPAAGQPSAPAADGSPVAPGSAIPASRWVAAARARAGEGYAPPDANGIAAIDYLGPLPWQIAHPVSDTSYIYGYTTKPSYLPGETIVVKVSTTAPTFSLGLWRYDATATGRDRPFVAVEGQTGLGGGVGGAPTIAPTTHMVSAAWPVAARVAIPDDAPSGVYLLRLAAATEVQSYLPVVVRRASAARYLYVVPSMTWQAYNTWGGTSLYQSIDVPSAMPGMARAQAVSYDRPYLAGSGFPMFGDEEMAVIRFLQENAYDVAYTTDTDLSIDPSRQPLPKAVIIGGHSEYWTTRLYDWLDTNINRRGRFGLASFGANGGFWACTMRDSGRTQRCLKREADHLRDMARPEQAIFGAAFGVVAGGGGPVTLSAAAAGTGLLAGTGLVAGSSLGPLAGYEVDQVQGRDQCGRLKCRYDTRFATGTIPQRSAHCSCPFNSTPFRSATMIRQLPSGRRVFAAGSLWWGYGLDPEFASTFGVPAGFPRLVRNILAYVAR